MFEILYNPTKTIEKVKKQRNVSCEISTISIASILIALAITIRMLILKIPATEMVIYGLTLLIGVFIIAMFYAFIYYYAIKLMTNKGKFIDSLTAISKTTLIFSVGLDRKSTRLNSSHT